ncbi:MAG: hypothetical protein WB627_00565 [Candidatus Acidiferrum sp.]
MRIPRFAPVFVCLLVVLSASAQQSPSPTAQAPARDPQAIGILNQAVTAAGGVTALDTVQDVAASGTVTFNWADQPVSGSVTVKGRGIGQYRLEANLQSGPETWAVNNGQAFRKDANGTLLLRPFHAPTFENVVFPVAIAIEALGDPTTSVAYVGLETRNGTQVQHLRIIKSIASDLDITGVTRRAATTELFVDPNSFQIRSLVGVAFSIDRVSVTCPREIQYSNYQTANGILIPFSITELIAGQQTLSIELNQVTFNSNLSDSDFQP